MRFESECIVLCYNTARVSCSARIAKNGSRALASRANYFVLGEFALDRLRARNASPAPSHLHAAPNWRNFSHRPDD
jgi:hypothetical protein